MTRRGYTLIEVLLVLAVLAVIAGMAWPSVVKFSGEQAIKDAAEAARAQLDRTRFRAIDAGVAYQFRYEPGGRRFISVPAERDDASAGAAANDFSQLRSPEAGANSKRPVFSGRIREGLAFRPAPNAPAASESVAAEWLTGLPDASELQQTSWSAPILYLPDGTGTTARFRVADEERRFIELSVRELTGMATAGPLRRETAQ